MFGLIAGAFFSLLSSIGILAGQGRGPEAMLFGAAAIVVLPLVYGFVGFIGGALAAVIYNLAAMVVGGIELSVAVDVSDQPVAGIGPGGDSPFIME